MAGLCNGNNNTRTSSSARSVSSRKWPVRKAVMEARLSEDRGGRCVVVVPRFSLLHPDSHMKKERYRQATSVIMCLRTSRRTNSLAAMPSDSATTSVCSSDFVFEMKPSSFQIL